MLKIGSPDNSDIFFKTSDNDLILYLHENGLFPSYMDFGSVYFKNTDGLNLLLQERRKSIL